MPVSCGMDTIPQGVCVRLTDTLIRAADRIIMALRQRNISRLTYSGFLLIYHFFKDANHAVP